MLDNMRYAPEKLELINFSEVYRCTPYLKISRFPTQYYIIYLPVLLVIIYSPTRLNFPIPMSQVLSAPIIYVIFGH